MSLADERKGVGMGAKGTVELRSGVWAWDTMEVPEGEGEEVGRTTFFFQRDESKRSRMRFTLPGGFPDVDESSVALRAKQPHERELRAPEGTTWRFYPLNRQPLSMSVGDFVDSPCTVLFRSSDGKRRGTGELPLPDLSLGDATDEELLEIVEALEG